MFLFFLTLGGVSLALAAESVPWLPAEISLPADRQTRLSRSIGGRTHVLSFETGADAAALFAKWKDALSAAGYSVEAPGPGALRFSGKDISHGEIKTIPSVKAGKSLLQIDVSRAE